MAAKKLVGYDAFTQWEVDLVRGKARGLVGKYGFTYQDVPDLEQELLLHVDQKRKTRDSWNRAEASERTVMSRILDNRIRDIIDSIKTDKRRIHTETDSLSAEVGQTESGEPATLEDFLSEEQSPTRQGHRSVERETDLKIEFSLRADKLSDLQNRISDLLKRGFNIAEAAKALGMPRTTLNREIARMRKVFYQEGLDEYL